MPAKVSAPAERVASQGEVARWLGISHTALQKAAQSGRMAKERPAAGTSKRVRAGLASSSDPVRKAAAMVSAVPARQNAPGDRYLAGLRGGGVVLPAEALCHLVGDRAPSRGVGAMILGG